MSFGGKKICAAIQQTKGSRMSEMSSLVSFFCKLRNVSLFPSRISLNRDENTSVLDYFLAEKTNV